MESFVKTAPVENREATLYGGPTDGIGFVLGCQVDVCHLQREEGDVSSEKILMMKNENK